MKKILFLLFLPCLLSAQQEISKPERATYYTAYDSVSGVYHVGITEPDQVTTSGMPSFIQAADEIGFLEKTKSLSVKHNPLPFHGEDVEQGIYSYKGKFILVRQQHTRDTTFQIDQVPALFGVHRPNGEKHLGWIANERVQKGTVRRYSGILYICVQPHFTLSNWQPSTTPALWEVYNPDAGNKCPKWVQPESTNPYRSGDCVKHKGKEWINTGSDANVWEPGVFGWIVKP